MDKRNRQAQLPIEPIYCAAPQEPHDILCPGSDDELDEPARLAKRLRYEEQGLRYLEGRPPRLISASLRGPFDKGWQNPWLPKRQNTKSSVSRPTVPRPAVKSTAPKALARLPGSKNGTPITGDSMQCHLPSPESNRELQLDDHASLDFEKRFLIYDWANGVSSDTLDRDDFWAPNQGRGAEPHSGGKKRHAASDWLKSKLSKRRMSDRDAPPPAIHTPTPAAAIVETSTGHDPDLPMTSLEMTTPSSSTGLCSAKFGGKTFHPVAQEEDTDMFSNSASSSDDKSQVCVSQQDATGVVGATDAPQASSPGSSEDHRQTVFERIEADEADIAFDSHMDDSFHYRIRPVRHNVARSASPILITTETGAQPEQWKPSGLENNQRSRSCDVQESTFAETHPKQDYRLASILERAGDMAEESQEVHPQGPTSYQRALSLPLQLCQEEHTATAELNAPKRAKSAGPEHRPENQHKPIAFQDTDAVLVPVGDITMPKNRDPVRDQINIPDQEVAATPKSSDACEAEGARNLQMEGPSKRGAISNSTEIPGIDCETLTRSTSLEKVVLEGDTTLIGDATHSGHKPQQDTCSHASDEPSVSDSLSGRPEVDVVTEVVCAVTQNDTLVRTAVSGLSVSSPQPETVFVQDFAQEAPEKGSDVENAAAQRASSLMELEVTEHTAGLPARLSDHIEETSNTPDLDEHTGGEERPEEGAGAPDMDGHSGKGEVMPGRDDLTLPPIEMQRIVEPETRNLQSEPVEGWVPYSRHKTPTRTPSPCQGQDTIGISQQTPWAAPGLEDALELELPVKSFAKFNTPSPKPSQRSYKYPRLSGGHLPSSPLFFDVTNTNPWSVGHSQSGRRSSRRSSRRVSFAPLPGEEEAANEQPSARDVIRPKSPPLSFDTQEGAEDLDDQFSSHFNAVKRRHDQEPKTCLQRLLPTESQQQRSPAVNAMATAFREADAYHAHVLEDCPTPASGLQGTVENEEDDECTDAPQSPWRSDTQTLALDPVAAVLQNLDDYLNPRWDTEISRKPARRSGVEDCLEDQENRGIQVGWEVPGIWETA